MTRLGPALLLAAILAVSAAPAAAMPRIHDEGFSLFTSTEADLEAQAAAIHRETGVQVHVLLVQNLQGRTARDVARDHRLWSSPGPHVVLLVAMADRQVRVETDPSLAERHPDIVWARMIEARMLTTLRQGRHAKAIRLGLEGIHSELTEGPGAFSALAGGTIDALRDTLFVLFAGLLAALSINRLRRERMWRASW